MVLARIHGRFLPTLPVFACFVLAVAVAVMELGQVAAAEVVD
jgi:hypothetical protein